MNDATRVSSFDWALPYPSRRQPILARNAVATSQPLATQAGIAMLQRGGNAVDAALATAISLTVLEPCSNGSGSVAARPRLRRALHAAWPGAASRRNVCVSRDGDDARKDRGNARQRVLSR